MRVATDGGGASDRGGLLQTDEGCYIQVSVVTDRQGLLQTGEGCYRQARVVTDRGGLL